MYRFHLFKNGCLPTKRKGYIIPVYIRGKGHVEGPSLNTRRRDLYTSGDLCIQEGVAYLMRLSIQKQDLITRRILIYKGGRRGQISKALHIQARSIDKGDPYIPAKASQPSPAQPTSQPSLTDCRSRDLDRKPTLTKPNKTKKTPKPKKTKFQK